MLRSVFLLLTALPLAAQTASVPKIQVTIDQRSAGDGELTGRLMVAISKDSKDSKDEPRMQIDESYQSQQIFGMDVTNAKPGTPLVLDDANSFGFPIQHLHDLPPGEYTVQAVFNRYERFQLANGKTVLLPPDKGEGQHWNLKPGNPMSKPVKVKWSPDSDLRIEVKDVIPPVAAPEPDTKYLRHVRIRSELLSRFWGRDMYLSAIVILPDGFDTHPSAHYPTVVYQDHFHANFSAVGWRETPPTPELKGREAFRAKWQYAFYEAWTNGTLPRVLLIEPQHANPYYDDSYAVNSANVGPYGDAITQELIPAVEKQFRGIGQGWARATYGGSTGGWEALASQVFYPEFYNGTWALCPDPVDFHAYQVTNLYDDENAYVRKGPFATIEIPSDRRGDGNITAQMAQVNHYELALGSHGRSGEQYDIWQAVFSPQGEDGYPAPVYDKLTGKVDKKVVEYWRDHYDLDAILMRDWTTLGLKLEGKLHIAVGDSDTYFLNNAVYLMQENLKKTRHPHSDATFDFGPRQPHCYTGARPDWDESEGADLNQRVLPLMARHMIETAPKGADVESWRY
ncbi:alpha/beta hydrolase-fold protein [Edaphobacter modestus]|uniref:Putative esterase n=1 Tax=Edaphobacter modestus TaxID=388466 RepID=A0A4Q7YXY2_9BACT|nr:alpha/beta hydrolase-fold protein [Edaphobacter modestus]RZU41959.1 putative esterase [Edaphobacter modestus]